MLLSVAFLGCTIFGYFTESKYGNEKAAARNALLSLIAWIIIVLLDVLFFIGGAFND